MHEMPPSIEVSVALACKRQADGATRRPASFDTACPIEHAMRVIFSSPERSTLRLEVRAALVLDELSAHDALAQQLQLPLVRGPTLLVDRDLLQRAHASEF